MINLRKYLNGGCNADDDFEFIEPGQWVNSENTRVYTTDGGATGRREAVGGMKLLFNNLPSGTNLCNGGCADDSNNRLFFFNWNSNGEHAIYCYDKTAGVGYTVLLDGQVEDGLNFSKYHYIHSAVYIDGNIAFTDRYNEPRYVNVDAGIKLNQPSYVTDQDPYVTPVKINLIKRPPIYQLSAVKTGDVTFTNNYIYNNSYKFRYQYLYKDNQTSVLSTFSQLIPFNVVGELRNAVDLTVNFSEKIDDYVSAVIIWAKNLVTNKTFEIKRFDKGNAADLAAINDHNAGTTNLSYRFFDNVSPVPLDSIMDVTPFDNVPLLSEAVEAAKNRLFLANNKVGYTSPKETSISAAIVPTSAGTVIAKWKVLEFTNTFGGATSHYTRYLLDINDVPVPGYYYFSAVTSMPPPASIDFTTGVFVSADPYKIALAAYFAPTGINTGITFLSTVYTSIVTNVASLPLNGMSFLKSGAAHDISIAFYDRERRKCGIVNQPYRIIVPERDYAGIAAYNTIQWDLLNTNALTEIPAEAWYYQISMTNNLTTRFFVQARASNCSYVNKAQDGTLSYAHTTFVNTTTYAIGIELANLPNYGMGYTYNEGDLVKIFIDTPAFYQLMVIGVDGNYLLVQPQNIGTLDSSTKILFEIFTPYRATEKELYYERGDMMPVNNPGTLSREYSSLTGFINGDIYILERLDAAAVQYDTENMSRLDEKWKLWFTDAGWASEVDNIGQVELTQDYIFSDVYIQGTKVNGLNRFQPLNTGSVNESDGAIKKLILANKIQTDGTVMLAICENETVSMYLGETELFDSQGSANVVKTKGVIGSTKSLKGSLGTYNPESAIEYNGLVWFYDQRNSSWVQYSNNGLFPISKNKFVRPTHLFSQKFKSLSVNDIEALGSRPFVIGGFDPYHKEALFSIPSTEATPPKGYLPDYPGVIYPYDIYDGRGKTLVYKQEADVWLGSMTFEAEKFIRLGNDLYAFKDGALYICNQSQPANFFGVQHKARIMYSNNPGGIHTFHTLGLESNKKPSFVHLRTEDPYIQSSDLIITDFKSKEGIKYAPLLRDRFSPNTPGSYTQKQLNGDRLFGKFLLVMLEFDFLVAGTFDSTFDATFDAVLHSTFGPTFDNSFQIDFSTYYNALLKLQMKFSDVGHTINKGHLINKNAG